MTLLTISLADNAGGWSPGDNIKLGAPTFRKNGDTVISTALTPVYLDATGSAQVELAPGPVIVQFDCRAISDTEPRLATVPDSGTITLAQLLENADGFEYTPEIIAAVAAMRDEVVDAANSAVWTGDVLTVLGASSPPLTGPTGPPGTTQWAGVEGKPSTFPPAAHTHPATDISDSTTVGRSLVKAADAAAARAAIGAGTSSLVIGTTAGTAKSGDYAPTWSQVTGKPSTFPPAAHTHPATDISDSTAVGRSVLTAADAAAARAAIGAAASDAGSGTVTAHTHPATDISDSTATGRSVLTAADAAAARTAIGAGTSSLALGTTAGTAKAGDYAPTWSQVTGKPTTFDPVIGSTSTTAKAGDWKPAAADITDSTTIGQSVLKAATTAAARTAIGAGTSNLALGTTSSTAKAGNYQPTAANISDATVTGRSVLTAADAAAARTAIGAASASDVATLQSQRTTSTTTPAGGTITLTAPGSPAAGQMHIFEILPTASTTVTVSALGPRADGVPASLTVAAGGVGLVGARWSSSKSAWHVLTATVVA